MGVHGFRLLSLICAGLFGGYIAATAFGVLLGGILPLPRAEATLIGVMSSYVVYVIAIIYVFSVRKPTQAWLVMLLPSAIMATAGLILGGPSA